MYNANVELVCLLLCLTHSVPVAYVPSLSHLLTYTVVLRRYAHPKKPYLCCKSGGGRDNEDAQ